MSKDLEKNDKQEDIITILYNEYLEEKKKEEAEEKTNCQTSIKKEENNKSKKYREVIDYEEFEEKEDDRKIWKILRTGLAITLVSSICAFGKYSFDLAYNHFSDGNKNTITGFTVETANDKQLQLAQDRVDLIKERSGYKFEHLTNEELLDACFRISDVERAMHISVYQNHFFKKDEDDILLEKILQKTYGKEFSTYSSEKIRDLKKMAYELLDEDKEKQDCIRDPERLRAKEPKVATQEKVR